MKKIFITGGSGTVGTSFIRKYYEKYKFYSFSRGEKAQVALKRLFPNIEIILGSIDDHALLSSEINKINPDIVIHAAALKHVDTAEKQPSLVVQANIIGSLNVIKSSQIAGVPLTVGISTDKACSPDNLYGHSKHFMEKMFLEANNSRSRFICCRFGNVAWSNGSVLPFWLSQRKQNNPLWLTDKKMNRLMFTSDEAAELINKCLELSETEKDGFILSKKMKTVNMFKLSSLISSKIKIVGLRPGEKVDEDLISNEELEFSYVFNDYILIKNTINKNKKSRLKTPLSSQSAEKMSDEEMMNLIKNVSENANKSNIDTKLY